MCTSPWIAYGRPGGHGPSQVSKAVCVGITASDVGVRSFSVASGQICSPGPSGSNLSLICVRISERHNYNYIFSNEQFGSVFVLAGAYVPNDIGNDTLTPVILEPTTARIQRRHRGLPNFRGMRSISLPLKVKLRRCRRVRYAPAVSPS